MDRGHRYNLPHIQPPHAQTSSRFSKSIFSRTECAALLRYFGIRAVIVDFPEGGGGVSTASATGKRPFESAADTANTTSSGSGGSGSTPTMSERLVSWAERYFNQSTDTTSNSSADAARASTGADDAYFERTFLPPVYFQHQGHSRTIVGESTCPPLLPSNHYTHYKLVVLFQACSMPYHNTYRNL